MREVTISTGRTFEVRPLTRKEIRTLAAYNIGHLRCDILKLPGEKQDEGIEAVLATQIDLSRLDDTSNPDVLKLFNGIIAETYSRGDEEKNSSRSGPSDQTPEEKSTAGNA